MPDWQLIPVALAVVFAASYLARAAWKTWRPGPGACGGGCCGSKTVAGVDTLIPPEDLVLRRRPGPRIRKTFFHFFQILT